MGTKRDELLATLTGQGYVSGTVSDRLYAREKAVYEGGGDPVWIPTNPSVTWSEDFEVPANNDALTIANTSMNLFSGVGTKVCSTAQFITGVKSALVSTISDGDTSIMEADIGISTNPFVGRFYIKPVFLPDTGIEGEINIAEIRGPSNTVKAMMELTDAGNISIKNNTVLVDTSVLQLIAGEWARIEWMVNETGTQTCRIFVGANLHGIVPDEVLTGAYGQINARYMWFGIVRKPHIFSAYWDSLALHNDWIGPALELSGGGGGSNYFNGFGAPYSLSDYMRANGTDPHILL